MRITTSLDCGRILRIRYLLVLDGVLHPKFTCLPNLFRGPSASVLLATEHMLPRAKHLGRGEQQAVPHDYGYACI